MVFGRLAGGRRSGQIGKVDDGSVCKVLSFDQQSESYRIARSKSGWHCNTEVHDGWIGARNALVVENYSDKEKAQADDAMPDDAMPDDAVQLRECDDEDEAQADDADDVMPDDADEADEGAAANEWWWAAADVMLMTRRVVVGRRRRRVIQRPLAEPFSGGEPSVQSCGVSSEQCFHNPAS